MVPDQSKTPLGLEYFTDIKAILKVENILGRAKHNVWTVNTDTDYHEIRKG